MAESSLHKSPSPKIKEEPVTLDKPESPNPFLPTSQVDFTLDEITFTTNNEVALIYPSHPNQEYFIAVLDFISKCCLKEAFTRAPTQYKEYLGGVRGEIGITTFRNALKAHYLPHSTMYVPSPFITTSSSTMDKSPSHPLPPTPVVGEMHKEAQQAGDGPTSLGATSKEGAHPQLSSGSNLDVLVDKSKFTGDGLKTVHNESGASKELGADEISKKIKLEDLANFLKDTRSAFFTPDSPPNEPINDLDESDQEEVEKAKETLATSQDVPEDTLKKELEQLKATAKDEVSSLKAKPSYSDINQLTTLLVAELKNTQWELPAEFFDLPHLTSSVQENLNTLDSLLGLLKMITDTLNRFSTLVENASGATITGVPSADKAAALPAEGENDADTNLKIELVDLLGIDIVTQYYNKKLLYERYSEKMKKRRQSSKIINCDVLTKKGPILLKVYKEDGTAEVIEKFKACDLQLVE
nr:hypothetical protein [Tanacetum cinerariifolium]